MQKYLSNIVICAITQTMSIKPIKYHSKDSAKFLLKIHLILVCKYRKQLLTQLGEDCKQIMFEISQVSDCFILQ